MSRTRIVGGRYTKLTKGNHYMFSDQSITTFTPKQIYEKGEENGILHGTANAYEPWKNKSALDWYSGIFGYTVNKRISIGDLGVNKEVQMCLTAISSVIRFESFNIDDKEEYKYDNSMFILTLMINNRGELVEGDLTSYVYKANKFVESIDREIKDIHSNTIKLKSVGKDLHDEIFLDKKLIFANDTFRVLDGDNESSKEDYYFYNRTGNFLKEASIFNRRADISYVFAGMGNSDNFLDTINNTNAKISLTTDCPLLKNAIGKFKGLNLFSEMFGVFSSITGTMGSLSDLAGLKNMRGPIMLDDVQCMIRRPDVVNYFKNEKHYSVSTDFEKLQIALQAKHKAKKDE